MSTNRLLLLAAGVFPFPYPVFPTERVLERLSERPEVGVTRDNRFGAHPPRSRTNRAQ